MGAFSKIVKMTALYTGGKKALSAASNVAKKAEQSDIKKRTKYLDSCPPGKKGLVLSWGANDTVDEIEVSDSNGDIIYYVDSEYNDSKRNLRVFDVHGNVTAYILDKTGIITHKGKYPLYIGNQQVGIIEAKYKSREQEFVTSDGIRIFKGKKDKEFHIFLGDDEIGKIVPKGKVMNLRYIVTFPNDAPDMMFLLMTLAVYIFNSVKKSYAKELSHENLEGREVSASIHREEYWRHVK